MVIGVLSRMRRGVLVVAVAGVVGMVLAGCGDSDSGGSTGASTASTASPGSGGSSLSDGGAAKAALAKFAGASPTISLAPLSAKAPAGKRIDFVSCSIPVCIEIKSGVQAAAKELGWTVKVIDGGLSASTYVSAMDQVVQDAPDAAFGIGLLPNTAIKSQLSALAKKHIPWLAVASPSPVGPDMLANFSAAPTLKLDGTATADWVAADSNGTADVAYFWDATQAAAIAIKDGFSSELAARCPKCHLSVQTMSFSTGVGTTDPPKVVSYLQAHPSVTYLVIASGDAIAGIPQAISAAGLANKVKIVTRGATATNIKNVASGAEAAAVTDESNETGWRMTDAAARHFLGDPLTDPTPTGVVHVITKTNLPTNHNAPYTVPNYQTYFRKAWQLNN